MARVGKAASFLGTGWTFPPTFELASGQVAMVSADADIQQSLQVLFSTIQGERIGLPLFGCNLHNYVFGPSDSSLYARLRSEMRNAILYFEPRISVLDIAVVPVLPLNGQLDVHLSYLIRTTNVRSNMVYPFYLQGEGSNVRRIA